MRRQDLLKPACGLIIGIAGALAPGWAQAADDYADRYVNGYLNDPYTNEVAADTPSVLSQGTFGSRRGAEGPMRDDSFASDDYAERYLNGYLNDPYTNEVAADTPSVFAHETSGRGAEGPIRRDALSDDFLIERNRDRLHEEMTLGFFQEQTLEPEGTWHEQGAQGPMREDTFNEEGGQMSGSSQGAIPRETYVISDEFFTP